MALTSIHGYDFGNGVEGSPTHLLIYSSVFLDACKFSPETNKFLEVSGWGRKRRDIECIRLEHELERAMRSVREGDLDCAKATLEEFNSLGIGLYTVEEAERFLKEHQLNQEFLGLPDGYELYSITEECAYLEIWLDR